MDKNGGNSVPDNLRRVPVTAMVVLALSVPSIPNSNVASRVQQSAINYLVSVQTQITDPFSIALTTYALMATTRGTHSTMLAKLKSISRYSKEQVKRHELNSE